MYVFLENFCCSFLKTFAEQLVWTYIIAFNNIWLFLINSITFFFVNLLNYNSMEKSHDSRFIRSPRLFLFNLLPLHAMLNEWMKKSFSKYSFLLYLLFHEWLMLEGTQTDSFITSFILKVGSDYYKQVKKNIFWKFNNYLYIKK